MHLSLKNAITQKKDLKGFNMNILICNQNLDLTAAGLFPDMPEALEDDKCLLISKVYKEIAQNFDLNEMGQNQNHYIVEAKRRYEFLSKERRLHRSEIVGPATELGILCVQKETIIEYFSYRLTPRELGKYIKESQNSYYGTQDIV